jgi:hypothetical protein
MNKANSLYPAGSIILVLVELLVIEEPLPVGTEAQ